MREPAYPPARAVAARVEAYFAQHLAAAHARGIANLAPPPRAETIEAVIDAGFWASFRREEGRTPKISLALLPPDRMEQSLLFEEPIPLATEALARLAPAVVRPGIHLGVWRTDGKLSVWGITRALPCLCFVLEVVEPGLLVVKYRRGEGFGKFGNVAVLQGEEVKMVDERLVRLPDYPSVLTSLLSFDLGMSLPDAPAVLVQLALSMRAHGHGGTLLVVPPENQSWRNSIVWPVPYALAWSAPEITALLGRNGDKTPPAPAGTIQRAIDAVAGLTAVDGATVISSTFEVLAFGVKIGRSNESRPVTQVLITEPIIGDVPTVVHPTRIGGTRHLSAAQFVYDQRDTLALVASQGGRFTLFAWSPSQEMVRAHQIAALLV